MLKNPEKANFYTIFKHINTGDRKIQKADDVQNHRTTTSRLTTPMPPSPCQQMK
jgi:hypothetical protein